MTRLVEALGWATVHALWAGALLQIAWSLYARRQKEADARHRFGSALLVAFAAVFFGVAALFLAAKTGTLQPTAVPNGVGTAIISAALPDALRQAAQPLVLPPALRALGCLWLLGATVFLVRAAGGWWLARSRYLRTAGVARAAWRSEVAELAAKMRLDPPRVLESGRIESPAIIGFLSPALVLPSDAMAALQDGERRAVLVHELCHLSRRDPLWSLLHCACEVLFFFHPFVWLLGEALRVDREKLCDAVAARFASTPMVYVRALLRLEELRDGGAHAIAARGKGALLDRIRYLFEPPAGRGIPPLVPASVAVAALTLALAGVVPPSLTLAARSAGPDVFTVRAADPAGEFSLTFRYGRLVSASFDGARMQPLRYRQAGDSVVFAGPDENRQFAVRVRPSGGISWTARQPTQ